MSYKSAILLVDDDESLRRAVSKVLTAEGHSVLCAGLAHEALNLLKNHRVGLVVSDLLLPDMDGIAVLKAARELQPEIEVVLITGHGSVEKAVQAMQLGAYDFIEKPVDSSMLLKTVAKALEKQRLSSENRQLRGQLQQGRNLEALIGNNQTMVRLKQMIRVASASMRDGVSAQGVIFAPDYGSEDEHKIRSQIFRRSCAGSARAGRLAPTA